jgi:hypothetical protein
MEEMVVRHGSYDADEVQHLLRCFLAPIELVLFNAIPIELLFVGVVKLSTILVFSLLPLRERIRSDTHCVGRAELCGSRCESC